MSMPGARCGFATVGLAFLATLILPIVSTLGDTATMDANPVAFFLILPVMTFAVLFWVMTVHWLGLLAKVC